MQALIFDGHGLVVQDDAPPPQPTADEALVKVALAGICGTDLEIVRGYAGFRGILGHEFVGQVLECAAQPGLVGRRVVGEINIGCSQCPPCQRGRREHCAQRSVVGIRGRPGVFADLVALPVGNLHPVPAHVPDEAAVFTEPLAAAFEILEQVLVRPTDRVVVLGDGRLAQLVARVLALTGCRLTVVGRHAAKLALLSAIGLETAQTDASMPGAADVVVECTGQPAGFAAALDLLRPEGTLVLKSTYAGAPQADLSRLVVNEIRLVGSRCGPFQPALRALAAGRIDPLSLIQAIYPLSDGRAAFAHASQRSALKILLRPEAG